MVGYPSRSLRWGSCFGDAVRRFDWSGLLAHATQPNLHRRLRRRLSAVAAISRLVPVVRSFPGVVFGLLRRDATLTVDRRRVRAARSRMVTVRRIAFCASCMIAALATMLLGVCILQLHAVWDGGYDPIRDDGWPAGSMPIYFANMRRTIMVSAAFAIVCGLLAWGLRPRSDISQTLNVTTQTS